MYYTENEIRFLPQIQTLSKILNKEVRIIRCGVDPYSFHQKLALGIFIKEHTQYKTEEKIVQQKNI